MEEQLIVKNFGPIREVELDLRKVTVLIGEQASGKSVLAKLISVLRSSKVLQINDYVKSSAGPLFMEIIEELDFYNLTDFYDENSYVRYSCSDYTLEIRWDSTSAIIDFLNLDLKNLVNEITITEKRDKSLERRGMRAYKDSQFEKAINLSSERKGYSDLITSLRSKFSLQTFETEYIPAERGTSTFIDSWAFMMDVEYLKKFCSDFEIKKRLKKSFQIPPLDIAFSYNSKGRENLVSLNSNKNIKLITASNGVQSLVPIFVFVDTANPLLKYLFIIEEPELNLYPTTQKKLVEYLVEKCTKGDNRLIITTHSPYILTALNNCIEASNVLKANPDAKAQVDALVPPASQIAYEDVAAYYVADGTARSIMNEEYQMIDANALDDVSDELGRVHGELLDLKYQLQD